MASIWSTGTDGTKLANNSSTGHWSKAYTPYMFYETPCSVFTFDLLQKYFFRSLLGGNSAATHNIDELP